MLEFVQVETDLVPFLSRRSGASQQTPGYAQKAAEKMGIPEEGIGA